jgi:hypothetical protein
MFPKFHQRSLLMDTIWTPKSAATPTSLSLSKRDPHATLSTLLYSNCHTIPMKHQAAFNTVRADESVSGFEKVRKKYGKQLFSVLSNVSFHSDAFPHFPISARTPSLPNFRELFAKHWMRLILFEQLPPSHQHKRDLIIFNYTDSVCPVAEEATRSFTGST